MDGLPVAQLHHCDCDGVPSCTFTFPLNRVAACSSNTCTLCFESNSILFFFFLPVFDPTDLILGTPNSSTPVAVTLDVREAHLPLILGYAMAT